MNIQHSKSGQAMVELLTGLIAIVVLLLGLEFITTVAFEDLGNLLDARTEIAGDITDESNGNTQTGLSSYNADGVLKELEQSIGDGDYEQWINEYPPDEGVTEDGFHSLWDNSEPFDYSTGYEAQATKVDVTSPLFQEIIGRSEIAIENKVWMPSWDDLMQ